MRFTHGERTAYLFAWLLAVVLVVFTRYVQQTWLLSVLFVTIVVLLAWITGSAISMSQRLEGLEEIAKEERK